MDTSTPEPTERIDLATGEVLDEATFTSNSEAGSQPER